MNTLHSDDVYNQPTGAAPTAPGEPDVLFQGAASSAADAEKEVDVQLSQQVSRFGAGLNTAGDAMQFCSRLFDEQLQKAAAERPLPNVSVDGDSAARAAFLMLLTDAQQRELFIAIGKDQRAWPRIKPLVGSPPYHFLLPNDAGMLNASGFARGRINMTYDIGGRTASTGQFGPGQLVDEHTREYRIAPRQTSSTDPLPGGEYFRSQQRDMVLQVRVKKHSFKQKKELYTSAFKKQLFFPQPGETIVVQETSSLLSARGLKKPTRTHLRVKALWPRGVGGSTAAILVGF